MSTPQASVPEHRPAALKGGRSGDAERSLAFGAADSTHWESPYLTEPINRFGVYATDSLKHRPSAFDPDLPGIDFTSLDLAA